MLEPSGETSITKRSSTASLLPERVAAVRHAVIRWDRRAGGFLSGGAFATTIGVWLRPDLSRRSPPAQCALPAREEAVTDTDDYGLPISTTSQIAGSAYREGVRLILSAWPGADASLDAAIAADPDFALAHAARARLHAISAEGAAAKAAVTRAETLVAARGTERERSHVDVLAAAVTGRSTEALARALAHLDRWPRDTVILSLPLGAFGLLAFSGMVNHDQARVDLVEHLAGHFHADDWWFLTYRGWSLAENGEVARGRAMLERAIEQRRENANGVHAYIHALYEAGAGEDANRLIARWLPTYDRSGILHGHIAWHSALVALERGDPAGALAIYERDVQPSVSRGMPINVVSDAASLLWRIAAYGYSVPDGMWDTVGAYAGGKFPRAGHAFVDAHMAMIEAMAEDRTGVHARITALDALALDGTMAAGVTVPTIARAMLAFADADYARTVFLLEPIARDVTRIGGSGAQRDVVEDTLLVAYMRAGNTARARALLDRRLHRRPSPRDTRWRDALAA